MGDLLADLCERKKPVTVVFTEPPAVVRGRFGGLADDLEIQLLGEKPRGVKPQQSCTIVFHDGVRSRLFISRIRDLRDREPGTVLTLTVPEKLELVEERESLRVPLLPETALKVTVQTDKATYRPRPLDLSVGGILVKLAAPEVTDSEAAYVPVVLEMDSHRCELQGIPQRRSKETTVFLFAEVLRALRRGIQEVPESLRSILEAVEKEWFERAGSLE